MATSFDSVIDMALIIIRDYKLDALYDSDENSFKQVLQGYMLKGLPKFEVSSIKSLEYNLTNREFVEDLDDIDEKYIKGLRLDEVPTNFRGNKKSTIEYIKQYVRKLIENKK